MCYIYKIEREINKMSKDANLMKNVLVENVDDSITQGQKIKKQVAKKGNVINNDTIVNNILQLPEKFDFNYTFRFFIEKDDPQKHLFYITWVIDKILFNYDDIKWFQQNGVVFDDKREVQLVIFTSDKNKLKNIIELIDYELNDNRDLIGDVYDEFILNKDY
jgi:hypothetical protein